MTAMFAVLQTMPTRGELGLAALNAFIFWGLSFFGALSTMAFADVRIDPWAAVYGAMMPALVMFFAKMQQGVEDAESDETPSEPPAEPPRVG